VQEVAALVGGVDAVAGKPLLGLEPALAALLAAGKGTKAMLLLGRVLRHCSVLTTSPSEVVTRKVRPTSMPTDAPLRG